MVAGVFLSLLFSYTPGVKDWYDRLEGNNLTVGDVGFACGCGGV